MDEVTAAQVGRSGGRRGRRPRSLLGLGGTGLAVLLLLSACNAGQDAAVTPAVPDVANAHGDVGSMVLDVVLIESGRVIQAGAAVPLRGAFTHDAETPDQLVSVSTPAARSVQLLDADGAPRDQGIGSPADGRVDAVNGVIRLRLEDVWFALAATQVVPVTFDFTGAGPVTLDVPVAAPPRTGSVSRYRSGPGTAVIGR